jgi:hypothetical protein
MVRRNQPEFAYDLSRAGEMRACLGPLENRVVPFYASGMSESVHRSCKCGAIYRRTESMAPSREMSSFECAVCGVTMEHWNTAWVPAYRLIAGPVAVSDESRQPNS